MKKCVLFLCIVLLFGGVWSCSDAGSNEPSIEDLQKELADLKKQLEQNTKITKVVFEGDQMILTFADGSVMRTPTPSSIIPNIGANGNWWVNGVDLGMTAKAQIPVIGSNGNWWCDGVDTGKSAQGDKGDKGDKGDAGRGIEKIEYDGNTGVLKITLTDKSSYQFVLTASGEDGSDLGGNKLEDINGSYLLAKVYNGDFPFAEFTYDATNKLIGGVYYQNLLNAPMKRMEMGQTYGSNNKVASQTIKEYAVRNQMTPQEWSDFPERQYLTDQDYQDLLEPITADALFSMLFPNGLNGYTGTNPTAAEFLKEMLGSYGNSSRTLSDNDFIYRVEYRGNDQFFVYKYIRTPYEHGLDSKYLYKLAKESGQYYYYMFDEYYSRITKADAVSTSSFEIVRGENYFWNINSGNSELCFYIDYTYKCPAIKYTGNEDEKTGDIVKDYFTPESNTIYNTTGETGKFKMLKRSYRSCQAGDLLHTTTLNYVYNGNDFDVSGGNGNICYIKMTGDKISEVMSYEGSVKKQSLKFNYNADGKLATIDAPRESITGVAKFIYDESKNPVEIQVNVDKLQGKGYDGLLCNLGLAYRYLELDPVLGLVEKIKFASGNQTVLKINYNYGLKNFMNHTFTAMHPILSTFNMNNAISELIWAGHGSCFMAEYSDYNEGGYPTRFKGILQIADQFILDDDSQDFPINGSVATLYKLEYQKKK